MPTNEPTAGAPDLAGEPLVYRQREAAAVARVCLTTIRDAIRCGALIAHYPSPQVPVIFREDLIAWLRAAPTRHDRVAASLRGPP